MLAPSKGLSFDGRFLLRSDLFHAIPLSPSPNGLILVHLDNAIDTRPYISFNRLKGSDIIASSCFPSPLPAHGRTFV